VTAPAGGRDWARPIVHWAIEARDVAAQKAFYEALFSWEIGDGPFAPIEAGFGGPEPGPAGHLQASDMPRVSIYVQVRDLRETLDRAVDLGGSITAEPFQLEGQPTLAFITDPEGNPVGLVQQ
jgi:predicted enzyme related to lactoylglutathione lyase